MLRDRVQARLEALGARPIPTATKAGLGRDFISDILNGKKSSVRGSKLEQLAAALETTTDYLLGATDDASGGRSLEVPVLGFAGADNEGRLVHGDGDAPNEFAPIPPGGTRFSAAVHLRGGSMRGFADDGALIYFEDQRTPPTPDMIGSVCIVELDDGRVLCKRLLRGSQPGLFDLESTVGDVIRDVRIRWSAWPIAIVPPRQARQIIRRGGDD